MVRGNSFKRALNALPHDGPVGRGANRPRRRLRPDPRVEASAAVVAALRIRIVEVVQDARDLHALVLVQLVLEDAERAAAVVEHQVFADEPARVRQTVRKARGSPTSAAAAASRRRSRTRQPHARVETARADRDRNTPRRSRVPASLVSIRKT